MDTWATMTTGSSWRMDLLVLVSSELRLAITRVRNMMPWISELIGYIMAIKMLTPRYTD